VREARAQCGPLDIIDRCNLTVLCEPTCTTNSQIMPTHFGRVEPKFSEDSRPLKATYRSPHLRYLRACCAVRDDCCPAQTTAVWLCCRHLVCEARAQCGPLDIIDRCNLTVLCEPGQEDTAEFLAQHKVSECSILLACICGSAPRHLSHHTCYPC
jgi:hypothetical protein